MITSAGPTRSGAPAHTILIVDDDRTVADTFARILQLEGFGVKTAFSAEAAFEVANQTRPDAILLDVRMPAVDGLEFLRLLRARPLLAHIPVAIVTGDYFIADTLQRELEQLSAAIKYKPLFMEDLIALARKLVSSPA